LTQQLDSFVLSPIHVCLNGLYLQKCQLVAYTIARDLMPALYQYSSRRVFVYSQLQTYTYPLYPYFVSPDLETLP